MEKIKEIREILLGNFSEEDHVLVYAKKNSRVFHTVNDRWLRTRLFGLVRVEHRILFEKKRADRLSSAVYDEMQNIGRLVYLNDAPEALSVFIRRWWREGVMITAERNVPEGILTLTAFTYRGFLGRLMCFIDLLRLEKKLPYLQERLPREKKKKQKKSKDKKTKKENKKEKKSIFKRRKEEQAEK